MSFWRNLHVAITGASSGIGEALARELAAQGATLTLVARRRERMAALQLGAHVEACDLSDPAQATAWIDRAEAARGPIDVLVNNAGATLIAPSDQVDAAEGERVLQLNLHAPLRITRAILPRMLARKTGTIVDVASVAALAPPRGYAWYAASKAGLAAASESLRGEVRDRGVHVVTVYPGPIRTDMDTASRRVLDDTFFARTAPVGSADVLARKIRIAVERRRARIIYPGTYALSRMFPGLSRWIADRTAPPPKRLG
jgi:short-subunit dehydrogenase